MLIQFNATIAILKHEHFFACDTLSFGDRWSLSSLDSPNFLFWVSRVAKKGRVSYLDGRWVGVTVVI